MIDSVYTEQAWSVTPLPSGGRQINFLEYEAGGEVLRKVRSFPFNPETVEDLVDRLRMSHDDLVALVEKQRASAEAEALKP